MSKKIHINDLESESGCYKLEGDGHNKETIHKRMYDLTDGMKTPERTALMTKLYKRVYPGEPVEPR